MGVGVLDSPTASERENGGFEGRHRRSRSHDHLSRLRSYADVKLPLRLLIDKDNDRVVFAEANKEFVDILASFLTMPLGTIVRLLRKETNMGCIDKLYKSVEDLDTKYLQTEACKTMLLHPRNASEQICENLKINIDDTRPRELFRCSTWECTTQKYRTFSRVPRVKCQCGKTMEKRLSLAKKVILVTEDDGVFVNGGESFLVTDALQVTPVSTTASLSLLRKLGISDASVLEEKNVEVDSQKILQLLKRILVSRMPLTEVFLREHAILKEVEPEKSSGFSDQYLNQGAKSDDRKIYLKVVVCKNSKKVVYAEAMEEFLELVFSFLTFPLGAVVRLLGKCSSIPCIDNLYRSMETLSIVGCLKSKECRNSLLNPKLGQHFGCKNQLLVLDEIVEEASLHSCYSCLSKGIPEDECPHNATTVTLKAINPKLPILSTEKGGTYVKRLGKFLVTDEMVVTPFSPISGILIANRSNVPIADLVEREIYIGEAEALHLLKACLSSKGVLSNSL